MYTIKNLITLKSNTVFESCVQYVVYLYIHAHCKILYVHVAYISMYLPHTSDGACAIHSSASCRGSHVKSLDVGGAKQIYPHAASYRGYDRLTKPTRQPLQSCTEDIYTTRENRHACHNVVAPEPFLPDRSDSMQLLSTCVVGRVDFESNTSRRYPLH